MVIPFEMVFKNLPKQSNASKRNANLGKYLYADTQCLKLIFSKWDLYHPHCWCILRNLLTVPSGGFENLKA